MTLAINAQRTQDLHVQDTFEVFVELAYTIAVDDDWLGSMVTTIIVDGEGVSYASYEVVASSAPTETENLDATGRTLILTPPDGQAYLPESVLLKITFVAINSGYHTVYVASTTKDLWGAEIEFESSFMYVTVKREHEPAVTVHVPGVLKTTCPICGVEILTDPQTWQGHMEYVHSAVPSWEPPPQVSGGDYKCYGCGRQFYTQAAVLTHLYEAHRAVV